MGDKTNTSLDLHTKLCMIDVHYTVHSGLGYAVYRIFVDAGPAKIRIRACKFGYRTLPTETGCLTYLTIIYRLMDRIRHCLLIFYHNSYGLRMPFRVSLVH